MPDPVQSEVEQAPVPLLRNPKIFLACGCAAVFFPGSFVFGFPGVMAGPWQEMFNVDRSRIGQLMFFILAGTGIAMYLGGRLQEKIAPGRLIFAGNVLCAAATGLAAWAGSMAQINLWAFAQGFFCGFVYIPCLTVFQRHFPRTRGLVTGIINLTFGGSSALMSPVFSQLLISRGYQTACLAAMAAALCIGGGAALFIREPAEARTEAVSNVRPRLGLRQTLALPSFYYLYCVWAMAGAAGVSLIVLSAVLGRSLGYDLSEYVVILICFNILNGLGRLVCGRLADHYPKQKILMTVFFLASMAYLAMPHFRDLYVLGFLACFVGLAFGTMFTVSAPLVTECFGMENFGRVFGLVFTAYGFLAGFLGPWLSGIVLDLTQGNFMVVFTGFALFYLASGLLVLKVVPVFPNPDRG